MTGSEPTEHRLLAAGRKSLHVGHVNEVLSLRFVKRPVAGDFGHFLPREPSLAGLASGYHGRARTGDDLRAIHVGVISQPRKGFIDAGPKSVSRRIYEMGGDGCDQALELDSLAQGRASARIRMKRYAT